MKINSSYPDTSDKCILTKRCRNKAGYGVLRQDGRVVREHRLIFIQHYGLSFSDIDGLQILHSCDNPACININHLRAGTHQENMDEMFSRKRRIAAIGSKSSKAKIDEENVRKIKNLLKIGRTNQEIAKDFDINPSQISRINTGKIWRHVK